MLDYLLQLIIAIDQLVNAILLGKADETLSCRAYRAEQSGKLLGKIFRPLIDSALFFDKNHCYKSYLSEKRRLHLPKEFQ